MNRFVAADGLSWHIAEAGEGPSVLLVHGTAASTHSWGEVIPFLTDSYHVIAVDLPGHGQTKNHSSRDLSLDRMAHGIVALLSVLKVDAEIVVGHSAGAAILAWACGKQLLQPKSWVSFNGAFYPFGGAAGSLFSPIAKLVAFNPLVPRLLSAVATRATVEKLLRDTGSTITDAGVEQYLSLFKSADHVKAALGMMAAWDLRGMDEQLAAMSADCLFVVGSGDRAVPPETADRAAARCRRARVLRIPGFGHLLHEEKPQLAADIIRGHRT